MSARPSPSFFAEACEIVRAPDRSNVAALKPTLFAHRAAGFAVMLTRDRAGRQFVATEFDYRVVGRTYEASDGWRTRLHVVDWSTFGAGPEGAA